MSTSSSASTWQRDPKRKWALRVIGALLAIILVSFAIAAIYQFMAHRAEAASLNPPGQIITAGGANYTSIARGHRTIVS